MSFPLRLLTKRILIIANSIVVFFFLLACLVPFLDPAKWWFVSLLGLAFPFLFVIVVLFFIFWVFAKIKWVILSAIALIAGAHNVSLLFALHFPNHFVLARNKHVLRVVTWNVARFVELKQNTNKGSQTRLKMMELLKEQQADVLCLQEFHTSLNAAYYNNLNYVQKELHYPYYYFTWEVDAQDQYYSSVIFSRLPLIDTGRLYYPKPGITEVLLHADILFNGDTVRVFTTHLQSVLFNKGDYDRIQQIQHGDEGAIRSSRSIFSKLKLASSIRSRQAEAAASAIGASPYPVLFTGDLNDVPTSYTYGQIRGSMRDVFLEKGFGIGRTFSAISPTLRIDYIFADRRFSVLQVKRYVKELSDHYMMVADLRLGERGR